MMLRIVLVLILFTCTSVGQVTAATKAVDEAIKTLDLLGSDANKLKAYCAVYKEFVSAGGDEAKQAAADEKLNQLFNSFGPQFQKFLQVYQETDPSTEDGQALDAAYSQLDEKCEG